MPNPYQTARALEYGYRVYANMTDEAELSCINLVRKDCYVNRVTALEGKLVSYLAWPALVAARLAIRKFEMAESIVICQRSDFINCSQAISKRFNSEACQIL